MKPSENPNQPSKITVPRDRDVDTAETSRREVMPSPDTINIRDEDYPASDQPLPSDSQHARALHAQPPGGRDQLRPGSAGDAARPSKTGIMNPSLPPRGNVR